MGQDPGGGFRRDGQDIAQLTWGLFNDRLEAGKGVSQEISGGGEGVVKAEDSQCQGPEECLKNRVGLLAFTLSQEGATGGF